MNSFDEVTNWRDIGSGILMKDMRHWAKNDYAGEGLYIVNNDRSGCLNDNNMCSKPKVAVYRHYKRGEKIISCFLSYPNAMGSCNSYFWEIYPNEYGDIDRFDNEVEMEKKVKELLCEKQLFLEDLKEFDDNKIREHLVTEYEASEKEIDKYNILIAYESVGSWGCDSSSFFLLQEKETDDYYVVHGSHCSCYGFEGQFEPEKTTLKYLKSKHFYFSCGGYDSDDEVNRAKVKEYINKL